MKAVLLGATILIVSPTCFWIFQRSGSCAYQSSYFSGHDVLWIPEQDHHAVLKHQSLFNVSAFCSLLLFVIVTLDFSFYRHKFALT